jgi:DNA mismatch repair protein MSH3
VLLDELGRGTATRDGIAVAAATLDHLVTARRCLTLFSTHYPEIWQAPASDAVRVWHLAYEEEREEQRGSSSTQSPAGASSGGGGGSGELPRLVFSYRLVPGGASKSFGLNVARLAGLPAPVVMRAGQVAQQLERQAQEGGGRPGSEHARAEQPGKSSAPGAGTKGTKRSGDGVGGLLDECRAALSALRGVLGRGHEGALAPAT